MLYGISKEGRTPSAIPANISGDFAAAEFKAALQNTRPGKPLGP